MSEDLKDFFSLIGKAKKEKEDEFRSLVGDINIESIFSDVKKSLKEEKKKKEKEKRQIQALEAWLYSNPKKEVKEENLVEVIKEDNSFEIVDLILPKPLKRDEEIEKIAEVILDGVKEETLEDLEDQENIEDVEDTESHDISEEDTIDHALKILEQLKTKEEVQENVKDPEIVKIRRELEYLKNLVNAQGGGGEVRLEFLDDVDRTTAKTNNYFLKYDASSDKWIGASAGGAGSQNLDQTLGLGNTSSLGMSVGVITATYFVGDGSLLTNLPGGGGNSGYANTAGISTYASSAGIATYASIAGVSTYSTTSGIATYAITAGVSTYSINAGISTYASVSGIATYALVSGISTVSQGLTGNPNIGVNNIIATSATFSGNVSIAGTLTYEDVTNVDSIGLITARSGINIGYPGIGATINSNGSALFAGIITATSFSGNATSATYATISGVSTYSNVSGIATYATSAGVSTSVSGGTADVTSLILPDGLFSSGVTTTSSTSEVSIDIFSSTTYRSAKYQVQITRGSEYQITEIFIVHDDVSSYGTEYATVKTGSILSSFSTDILSGNVRLLATPATSSSTTFKLIRTLIEI